MPEPEDLIRHGESDLLAIEATRLIRPRNEGQRGFEDPIYEAISGLTLAVIALQQEVQALRRQLPD